VTRWCLQRESGVQARLGREVGSGARKGCGYSGQETDVGAGGGAHKQDGGGVVDVLWTRQGPVRLWIPKG
jgi:hypothetical protein